MESRFNAPVWAFVVVLAAYVPRIISIDWWPPFGVFLFVAFALTIIGVVQERLLSSVIMFIVLFIVGPFQTFVVPFMHAASFGQQQQEATATAQLAAGENNDARTPAASANVTVAGSQQLAVRKYPALAVQGSPLNTAFLARYARWQQQGDPRLQQPDWPQVLADDCAAHP